ncbi:ATP-dependent Clp protease adapter ClpS [Rarobacter faecitabidus]|uniref:ATP-dependent Clp protease adapter protein ClpS n=1 Tax=Rarobacter faecitabidus TaxID=13243 RepID=A0A542ZWR3_RARFA|nr:ATP-dependent Clp protease adapter ClpS [Rarobacter faecitabidus]TQL64804.1 ATP-dependent Clp protease adaptor protein ClpS [Rarobacter faecitabidus]
MGDTHATGGSTALASQAAASRAAAENPKWQVVVWDDPVNLMNYVEYVFRKHFGYTQDHSRTLMLRVHHEGKAVVATRSKERAEADVQALHGYGLQATMRPEARG